MGNNFDWEHSFTIDFALKNGVSQTAPSTKRTLSQVKTIFYDRSAADALLENGDPLIYEFYELGAPENAGDLAFGTSITYPGKVGDEYFMTKGHYHAVLDTSEVYFTLSGAGFMLMEGAGGDVRLQPLEPGRAVYVPKRYAHRSINSGAVPLITFFTLRGDAGHDYGSIAEKGFSKLIVERGGLPAAIDNSMWK